MTCKWKVKKKSNVAYKNLVIALSILSHFHIKPVKYENWLLLSIQLEENSLVQIFTVSKGDHNESVRQVIDGHRNV